MGAVDRALDGVAAKLDWTRAEAARGIVRIANNNMINALKLVSVNRGYDPRDFTLVAFGGGGGMHAVSLAAELGMHKVVVPRAADVFSAWGMLMSDLRRDYFVTRLATLTEERAAAVDGWIREVEEHATEQFAGENLSRDQVRLVRFGRLRYENQEHSVEVQLPEGEIAGDTVREIVERFHESYEREYTYRLDAPVEFVGVHVVASAEVGKLVPEKLPVTGADVASARTGVRDVDYELAGVHTADIYDGAALEPGMAFTGPAIVETSGTTVVVHPGDHVRIDDYGNLHIDLETTA
jgi:N-methylhydantoinase A